jgi:glyoxylase-like metal-dependent hydrolase (beta-lactamase superfamily II)
LLLAGIDVKPEEALEHVREAGIHRLQIPTPFAVGRVNCYLIEDDPLTLVDTGPNSGKSLDELEHQLADLGRSIADIELVVVPFVENFGDDIEADDKFAASLMLSHGIPEDVVVALRSVSRSFRAWGAKAKVTRPLHDGEQLKLRDRSLEVQHRPGHSPSDTVFWDADREILICADHLIAHISSNPLISRPLDGSDERPHALMIYIESLRKTRELPARILLPGHGEPITDHRALIDERFALHRKRSEKIHGLISERPRTAYEIAQELWGNVAVTQAFLTLSEVLGHMDLLAADGRAREVVDGELIRFEAT